MAIDREQGVSVVNVGTLLSENLAIPPYQRPYSWTASTALQLLDDIRDASRAASGRPYVLGAVILHRTGFELEVVDGQQRLLTLLMILRLLRGGSDAVNTEGEDPESPVVLARVALKSRIDSSSEDAEALAAYIEGRCELIRVETNDVDEAFRVFDSQNYRGKPLLPHDLLKAFHLREMRGETEAMQTAVVEAWESVPDEELDRLFSTYLFRIQRWSRGLGALRFTTREIDLFKGINNRDWDAPSNRYHLAAQAAMPMLSAWLAREPAGSDEHRAAMRQVARSRFQLDAPMTSGRTFFEMVAFMLRELETLRQESFDGWEEYASSDSDFREQPSRSRYRYVSELYLAAVLYYTNKFGDRDIQEARQRLFKWAYSLRTRNLRVQFISVDNLAKGRRSAFGTLRHATGAAELRRLHIEALGRSQDPGHEEDLVALLEGLVG